MLKSVFLRSNILKIRVFWPHLQRPLHRLLDKFLMKMQKLM